MSTVINNPGNNEESADSVIGLVSGLILLIFVVALFFLYILPMIREPNQQAQNETINIEVQQPVDDTVSVTP